MAKQKWWYRYELTWVHRKYARRKNSDIKVGAILLEKRNFGKSHTWAIIDIKNGSVLDAFTGKFIDKVPFDQYKEQPCANSQT